MGDEADANPTRPALAAQAADADRSRYDGNKPLGQIEDDIARTRVRLGVAIEALGQELAPGRLIENSADAFRDSLKPQADWLRNQVRTVAVPLALITTGLGWLFAVRSRYWRSQLVGSPREAPAEAVEMGETPAPAPIEAHATNPPEPVSLADD
jgi:uncharacterized protein DUF3618